jgi:AcrR family transcriptional regulator
MLWKKFELMGITERKEREKEQRRKDIVDAAERIFFSKGVRAATMDDVAEAAELSKGTLYLYFKNKEELYYAINLRGIQILTNLFRKASEEGPTGLEKTYRIGRAFLTFSQEYTNYFNALSYYEVSEVDFSITDSVASLCDDAGFDAIGILIEAIRTGIRDGSIRPELDPQKAALILWGMVAGVIELVTLKGGHLQKRHGLPIDSLVDETFKMIGCILEKR